MNGKMGRVTGVSLVLLLIMCMAFVGIGPVSAPATTISVVPTQSFADAGETFTVDIQIADVSLLFGGEFQLTYNSAVLENTARAWGPIEKLDPDAFPIDSSTVGNVWMIWTYVLPSKTFNGTGVLATLTFKVLKAGMSALDLHDTKLGYYDWTKTPPDGPIDHTAVDGDFHSQITISVSPASVGFPGVVPVTFTIDLMIAGAYNAHSIELKLGYATAVLDATDATEGTFLSGVGLTNFTKTIDDPTGYVLVNITLFTAGQEASGSGKLATIAFKGTVKPAISALTPYDAKIADGTGALIKTAAITLVPGEYMNIVPKATLKVEPASIKDPALTPGKTFSINVTVVDALDLYGFEFKLGYETLILDVVSVEEGEFLKSGGSTYVAKNEIREDLGRVWLAITLYNVTKGVTGSGRLAIITFKVTGMGETPLDLYETKLGTSAAEPLTHDVYDGYFNNIVGLAVDVYTQRAEAALFACYGSASEEIIVSARVTFNAMPVEGLPVAISVRNPSGAVIIYRTPTTDANGLVTFKFTLNKLNPLQPFGTYTVDAVAIYMGYTGKDKATFKFNYKVAIVSCSASPATVTKGSMVTITLKLTNYDTVAVYAVVTVTIIDAYTQLLATYSWSGLLLPGTTTITAGLTIPTYAQAGEATCYAAAYSKYPHLGGVPYCPECICTFVVA